MTAHEMAKLSSANAPQASTKSPADATIEHIESHIQGNAKAGLCGYIWFRTDTVPGCEKLTEPEVALVMLHFRKRGFGVAQTKLFDATFGLEILW